MIYCGYQGVGKSTYCRNNPDTAVDLDSSNFKKVDGWEKGYIDTALKFQPKNVFISAHDKVIKELLARGLEFTILAPKMEENAWRARLEFRYFKNPTEANMKAVYDFLNNFERDLKYYRKLEKEGVNVRWITATVVTDIGDFII